MTATARSESIGIVYEVLLIDLLQNSYQSSLYQFVLQRWYPQGTLLAAARFWYIPPSNSPRPVAQPLKPTHQFSQIGLQTLGVLGLGHPINAVSGVFP
jgi:hypothetical protein